MRAILQTDPAPDPEFDLGQFVDVAGRVLAQHLGGNGVVEIVGWHAGNINRIFELKYEGRRIGARVALNRQHFRYERDIIKEVFAVLLLYHADDRLDDALVRRVVDGVLSSPKGSHVAHQAVRAILHYDWSLEDLPFPYFLFEWVDGVVLWEAPSVDHYFQAGQVLAGLHRIRFEHFYEDIFAIRHVPRSWEDHLRASLISELAQALQHMPHLPRVPELGGVVAGRPCLVHNDYAGANLLVEPTGGLRVIDWDNWVVDCAELDLVKMKYWTAIGADGKLAHRADLFEAFLAGYREFAVEPVDAGRLAAYERLWLLRCFNFETSRAAGGGEDEGRSWRHVYPSASTYADILQSI